VSHPYVCETRITVSHPHIFREPSCPRPIQNIHKTNSVWALDLVVHSEWTMHMSMCEIPYGCKGKIPYECEGKRMGAWRAADLELGHTLDMSHSVTVTHIPCGPTTWSFSLTPVNHLVKMQELAHAHRFGGAEARKGPSKGHQRAIPRVTHLLSHPMFKTACVDSTKNLL